MQQDELVAIIRVFTKASPDLTIEGLGLAIAIIIEALELPKKE